MVAAVKSSTAEEIGAISPEYLDMLKRLALEPPSQRDFSEFGPKWGGIRQGVQSVVDGLNRGHAIALYGRETRRAEEQNQKAMAEFQSRFGSRPATSPMAAGTPAALAAPAATASSIPAMARPHATLPPAEATSLPGTAVDRSGRLGVAAPVAPVALGLAAPSSAEGVPTRVPGTVIDAASPMAGGAGRFASPPLAPVADQRRALPGMMRLGGPTPGAATSPMAMFPTVAGGTDGVDRAAFADQFRDPATRRAIIGNLHAEIGDQFGVNPDVATAKAETIANRAASRGLTLAQAARDPAYYPPVTLQRMQAVTPEIEARYGPAVDRVAGGSNVSGFATGNASGTVGFNGGPQTYQAPGTYERFGIEGPDRAWADRARASGGQPAVAPYDPSASGLPPIFAGTNVVGDQAPRGFAGQEMPRPAFQPQLPDRATPQPVQNFQKMSPAEYDQLSTQIAADRRLRPEQKQMLLKTLERHAPLTEQQQLELDTARLNQEKLRREIENPSLPVQAFDEDKRYATRNPRTGELTWITPPAAQSAESRDFRKARDKELGEARAKAESALSGIVDTSTLALDTINKIRSHPGRQWGTGWTGAVASRVPGTDARGFANLVDQAKGQTFLEAFNSLRGGGQITEVEGKKASQALARLDTAQNEKDFDDALVDLEKILALGMARARAAATGTTPQHQQPSAARPGSPLDEARAAIARGAPRDTVIERLRRNGIDPSGI